MGGEAEPGASSGAGDHAGGVQQAVAESFRFGAGEFAVEATSRVQASRSWAMRAMVSQAALMAKSAEGRLVEAGVFQVADELLGAATAALEGFEVGDVGVGRGR